MLLLPACSQTGKSVCGCISRCYETASEEGDNEGWFADVRGQLRVELGGRRYWRWQMWRKIRDLQRRQGQVQLEGICDEMIQAILEQIICTVQAT